MDPHSRAYVRHEPPHAAVRPPILLHSLGIGRYSFSPRSSRIRLIRYLPSALCRVLPRWVELSLRWLVACGRYSGYRGFKENAQYFLGASSAKLVHLCQVLLLCGGIVMIFVTACSLLGMPPERVLSLIVLVVFPLACQKSSLPQFCSGVVKRSSFRWAVAGGLHSLTSISMISFVCLAYFFGVLLVRLAHRAPRRNDGGFGGAVVVRTDMPLFWQGPPVLLMSFLCHTTMLQLDAELCTEAKAKVSSVIRLVVLGLALPVYATVGAGGFWLKGPKVSANVLQDFTQDPWMAAARLTLGVMNVAKLATAVITLRESLVSLAPSRLWRKRLRSWHGRAALSLATLVLGAVAAFATSEFTDGAVGHGVTAIPSLTTVLSLLGSTVGVLFSRLVGWMLGWVAIWRDDLEEPLLPSTPGRAESWAEGSIQVPRSDMEWLRQWLLGRKLEQPNFGTPRVDEVDVVGVSGENSVGPGPGQLTAVMIGMETKSRLLCGVVFTGGLFVGGAVPSRDDDGRDWATAASSYQTSYPGDEPSRSEIPVLDCNSSVWVTKDQREAGLKYLVEKHARQGAAITARTLSGLMANGEEEAKREEAEKSQKRQREGEVDELKAEMAKLEETAQAAAPSRWLARQAEAAKDAKAKKPMIVVKKPKLHETTEEDPPSSASAPLESSVTEAAPEAGLLGGYESEAHAPEREGRGVRGGRRTVACSRGDERSDPEGQGALEDQVVKSGDWRSSVIGRSGGADRAGGGCPGGARTGEDWIPSPQADEGTGTDVQQVQHRLTQLQEQVKELLASVESQQRLPSLVEQQKIARNLGEDLMEEMLKLDSLGNLCEDDRQVRKKALADLESLVEQVDAAKALLLQQRLQLEAAEKETVASTLETALDRLAEIRLPLDLETQTLEDAYVVTGFARGLRHEDLHLELGRSGLLIRALRMPTPEESSFLQRTLRSPPTLADYLAVGRGVFGRVEESLQIPMDVDRSRIQATCKEGHLRILLPRRLSR
ncbi:unnamed protein product [Durusdinium trenchii]|uniref:SHSP domain-containing protein n=1 Tax=Durusdinium trenchii TaxID=1381693 RepID=A0ABP0MVK8_9DINO